MTRAVILISRTLALVHPDCVLLAALPCLDVVGVRR